MSARCPGHCRETIEALLNVPRGTFEKLEMYVDLLHKWATRVNLVSVDTLNDVWERHILDSAQLVTHLSSRCRIIDIGSGAGFPGMVLSILGFQNLYLVEKDRKKCSFLKQVILQTGASAKVINDSIENLSLEYFSHGDSKETVFVSRAVSDVKTLLNLTRCFWQQAPSYVLLKGENVKKELALLNDKDSDISQVTWDLKSSITNSKGFIVKINFTGD